MSMGSDLNDSRLHARFWTYVHPNEQTGCWEWTGTKRRRGYGKFRLNLVDYVAHRFAYENLVGTIPAGMQIDHLCRVTGCVNPAHLEPVSQQENMRRAQIARGALPDHCKHGHAYTPANTYFNPHSESRVCRTCQNKTWRRYDAKRQAVTP